MQYTIFDVLDWREQIRNMLEELITEYELPPGSLYLSDNYGKKKTDQLVSHTIYIWEPTYPPIKNEQQGKTRSVITLRNIDGNADMLEISISDKQEEMLHEHLPKDAKVLDRKSSDIEAGLVRIRIPKCSSELTNYLKESTIYCVEKYNSQSASFGCCSSHIVCSDAQKCVHENKLYSTACMYRRNLEAGRIFYGKNRNI